jgi:hypothetical protein
MDKRIRKRVKNFTEKLLQKHVILLSNWHNSAVLVWHFKDSVVVVAFGQ